MGSDQLLKQEFYSYLYTINTDLKKRHTLTAHLMDNYFRIVIEQSSILGHNLDKFNNDYFLTLDNV